MINLRWIVGVLGVLAVGLSAGCTSRASGPPPGPDVAILVLDHFSEVSAPSARPPDKGDGSPWNCTKSGLPTNEVGSGGGGGGLPPGVFHGHAVFDTVGEELDAQPQLVPANPLTIPNASEVKVWRHNDNNRKVIVVGVEIGNYDTEQLATRINSFVTDLGKDPFRIARFVLNMSFVIVPCDLQSWWKAKDDPNLDVATMIGAFRANIEDNKYVDDLKMILDDLVQPPRAITVADLLADQKLEVVADVILTNLFLGDLSVELRNAIDGGNRAKEPEVGVAISDDDPLKKKLDEYAAGGRQVIPVGAAGNGILEPGKTAPTSLDFPFAPALWNSVVSVSAGQSSPEHRPAPMRYSNSGEIMMAPSNKLEASGTSFAAPHLSALEAMYLLNGGTAKCGGYVPTLGYADSDHHVFTWKNLWLDQGSAGGDGAQKCGSFANIVTA